MASVEDSVNTNAQRQERGGYGGVRRFAALAPFDFAQGRQDDYLRCRESGGLYRSPKTGPRRIVSWTLDVLNVVRALVEEREAGRAKATPLHKTFTLNEVYAHAEELGKRHAGNRNIEPKIRQRDLRGEILRSRSRSGRLSLSDSRLQVLRDMGLVEFLGGGDYCLN